MVEHALLLAHPGRHASCEVLSSDVAVRNECAFFFRERELPV